MCVCVITMQEESIWLCCYWLNNAVRQEMLLLTDWL